jgi:hypothetical protein
MRQVAWSGLVLLALPALASAQMETGWAGKLFTKDGVAHTSHDFGTVPRGTILTHKFTLTNIYAVPLQVTQVRVSCGCTTCVTPVPTPPIQPRESFTLEFTMNARAFQGPKVVNIYVTVGPSFISTAALTLTANSRQDVVVNFADPRQTTLGIVQRGQRAAIAFDVEYAGNSDWRVVGAMKTNAPVELTIQPAAARPPISRWYRVIATLREDAPPGPFRHEVYLQTNDPSSPYLPLLVEGIVQAPLELKPDKVNFGSVPVGEFRTLRVVIKASASQSFRVVEVLGQDEGLTVDLPQVTAPVQIVTIKYQPTKAGELKRALKFRTDLEQDSSATVTVEGNAVAGVP